MGAEPVVHTHELLGVDAGEIGIAEAAAFAREARLARAARPVSLLY